jgi:hypothetical protein
VLGTHGERASIGEPAVEALADDHVHGVAVAGGAGVVLEQVAQPTLPHRPHRQRVRQQDWALDRAELIELRQPRDLAVAVDHVAGAEHLVLVEVAVVRQDRRDARPAHALVERPVAHEHPRHVHEGVQLACGKAAGRVAELTQSPPHARAA